MTRLIHSAEFAGLVDAASRELRIPPGDIEKDIWVVEVLRSIVRPIEGARVVFKGGTSLSKAYGLIERFSEDVDLLIVANAGIGAGQLERVLKTLPRRAAEELGIKTKKEGESDRGVHRTERLLYSAVYPDAGRVTPGVLLEMGIAVAPSRRKSARFAPTLPSGRSGPAGRRRATSRSSPRWKSWRSDPNAR